MFKSTPFKNVICITTLFSFALTILPHRAAAYNLAPESFSDMYRLAQSGDVESLRASVFRGLNIDSLNGNGDTGLCVAAKRHDAYAYNAFRAAGANPHHPCVQNIPDYEEFVNSSRAAPVTETPRAAYGRMGKEAYSISPKFWWWAGGIALVGGTAAAIALASSGGGGSKSHKKDDPVKPVNPTETYLSLGSIAGTKANVKKSTKAYAVNNSDITSKNSLTDKIEAINLNKDVMENTKYLDIILKSLKGGSYTNNNNVVLKIGEGTIAMAALEKSYVTNNGYINSNGHNASLGMVASENSLATNNGKGIIDDNGSANGIGLNFSGKTDTDTVVGMYADTNSVLMNNGDIKGTAIKSSEESATVSANVGTIIGMEAMIINAGKNLNENTITLINTSSGKINLSSGDGGTENTIQTNLIGMGSYLNNDFMNGSYDINRAEKVSLTNNGEIKLSYSGEYVPASSEALRKGLGGIIGMRADANAGAINNADISIILNENNSGSKIDATAGMQSLHLADLTNKGNISITTSAGNARINYGMISVEGSGTVSGLYTNPKNQTLTNSGSINIQASNSYGIASFNGGDIKNTGTITLGKPNATTQYANNIGIYGYGKTTQSTISNTKNINVYSYDSYAMVNDFAGATKIKNNGTINIFDSATNSKVFGGYYSIAGNEGVINYYITKTGSATETGTADDPFSNYSPNIQQSVITSKSAAESSSSATEYIYNNTDCYINIYGSSFTGGLVIETQQAKAENNGIINLNAYTYDTESDSVAMYAYADANNFSTLLNSGEINTNSYMSAAMASDSSYNTAVINQGTINTNKDYSLGLYASQKSVLTNEQSGEINIKGNNSVAIYTNGNSNITNNGYINMGSSSAPLINSYGLFSKGSSNIIKNTGNINFYANSLPTSTSMAISSSGDNTQIQNNGNITVYGTAQDSKTYGIYAAGESSRVTNNGSIKGAKYGIYTTGEEVNIINNNKIESSYGAGIFAGESGATIVNNGNIKTTSGIGIYAVADSSVNNPTSIINNGPATIEAGTYGIYVLVNDSNADLTINNYGTINAGVSPIFLDKQYELPDTIPSGFEENIKVNVPYDQKYIVKNSLTSSSVIKPKMMLMNNGVYKSSSALNFDNDGITYVIGQTGTYQAPTLSGTVVADADIVTQGFETTYVKENAFIGENIGLNILSDSYLFKADLQSAGLQNNSLVMTMQSFNKVVDNKKMADFLGYNYKNKNNETFFNSLKSASTEKQFRNILNKETGLNIIPNIIRQQFETEKLTSMEINRDLLTPTAENNRLKFGFTAYRDHYGNKKELSGYKNKVLSAYVFNDKKVSDNMRYGMGISAVRSDTDYNDNSRGYNNSLSAFVPVIFGTENLSVLIKPKAGFERGHYRRQTINGSQKSNTQNYLYGVDTLAKNSLNIGSFTVEPEVGFNFTGLYTEGLKEKNDGLKTKDKNLISAQSLIGLSLNKKFSLNQMGDLSVGAGAKYFHEFGNKSRLSATLADMDGYYEITDKRLQRDSGLLDIKAVYEYEKLSLNTSFNVPLEQKRNPYFMFNIGYDF